MEELGSHWTDFHEILYLNIFRNLRRQFKFHKNLTRIMGSLHEVREVWISLILKDSVCDKIQKAAGLGICRIFRKFLSLQELGLKT